MARLSPLLWTLAGALIGAGTLFSDWFWIVVSALSRTLITGTSSGWPLILLGVILAFIIAWRGDRRGWWAALVGFGLVPATIVFAVKATWTPPCLFSPPVGIATPAVYHCIYYGPPWYDSVELRVGIGFLAIALLGALIPLIPRITRARRSSHSANANGAA